MRMQTDAVPATEIGPIVRGIRVEKAFPIYRAARLMGRPFGRANRIRATCYRSCGTMVSNEAIAINWNTIASLSDF
jgi:hypothetical protein